MFNRILKPLKFRRFGIYTLGMGLLLLGAVKLGLYHYKLLKADEIEIEPSSYDYYILVPSIIKNVPKVGMVLGPTYYNRYDFDEHDTYAVIFLSKEDPKEIRSKIEAYFIDHQFPKISDGIYRTGDASSIRVDIKRDPNGSSFYQVCVEQNESYKN